VARAQDENPTTPGAIPNPGTYQGSQTLQQQSDAQDQQFRAQQQQPAQQQYYQGTRPQQGYGPGGSRHMQQAAPRARLSSDPMVAAYQRGDLITAVRLGRAQAQHGNLNAWYYMGYFYEKGLGVSSNLPRALAWYRSCADLGHADCQIRLARLYHDGTGVPRDLTEAYKWLLIAGRNSAIARMHQPEVARELSYDQMADATRRYQVWKPVANVRPPEGAPPAAALQRAPGRRPRSR